jgi:23S rRNA pseudouridine2605 synthase
MRINKFIASATGLSRRAADTAIAEGRVTVNGQVAVLGQEVSESDEVHLISGSSALRSSAMQGTAEKRSEPYKRYGERASEAVTPQGADSGSGVSDPAGKQAPVAQNGELDRRAITPAVKRVVLILNKPVGYICSRNGQGGKTIYDLLPPELHHLKPVGRLDKNSSGLLLLTNDGDLANELTHPSRQKIKVYEVTLDKPLEPLHRQMISDHGVMLEDGVSKFELERLLDGDEQGWRITMLEGRNRQIRRTFSALGYEVRTLHRTHFGPYALANLGSSKCKEL